MNIAATLESARPTLAPSATPVSTETASRPREGRATLEQALELRDQFSSTFGTVLFGQMIHSMRQTVGKPAYFHGGQAEEMFRGQLDQVLSQHMAKASGERLVKPMFERKFPEWAAVIESASQDNAQPKTNQLEGLSQLTRR